MKGQRESTKKERKKKKGETAKGSERGERPPAQISNKRR